MNLGTGGDRAMRTNLPYRGTILYPNALIGGSWNRSGAHNILWRPYHTVNTVFTDEDNGIVWRPYYPLRAIVHCGYCTKCTELVNKPEYCYHSDGINKILNTVIASNMLVITLEKFKQWWDSACCTLVICT